ncbi:MAG: UvrD-helicase domain-containing protein [Clostridia bacterium]|nr:UvrD-helicase domain-containing protein [Clostridia bacterium]
MGSTWNPTPSQELAISVRGKTLLVSAAAGSGKTRVLTERIISTLTDSENPADLSRILVVTFTRAAAAELKGRIAEALSSALAEDPGNEHLSKQLLKLGSAHISTIDSFFQKLVRNNFEKLGLTANFRIAEDSEILPISAEVLEGLIGEYYNRYSENEEQDLSMRSLRNNRFAQVLDNLLSNRSDGKLNQTLLEFYAEFNSYPEGIRLLLSNAEQLRASKDQDFLKTRYGSVYLEFFRPLFECYLKDLDELEANMAYDPDLYAKCLALLSSDREFCRLVLETLDAKDYNRAWAAAKSFVPGRFPTLKGGKTKESEAYQLWRGQFRPKGVDRLQDCFRYTAEEIKEHMQRTADFCEIMYHFYHDYEMLLMDEKKQRGILEINDVRSMVYRLLTDPEGNASSFADALAQDYDAVYIDEYQDVDAIQDKIFALIGRNRRFMVGDIKQSIYGFRGSEPSIFAGYRRAFPLYGTENADNADGNSIFMSDNFRCDPPVISFTNLICSFLFSACEKSIGYKPEDDLQVGKKPPEKKPEGYPFPVQVAVFDSPKKSKADDEDNEEDGAYNQEAAWVAAEISRLLQEGVLDDGRTIEPSDIAILVRSKKHGKGVTQALKKLSIPVSSETSADFLHDPVLVDFLNLLKSIDNPYRDLSLSEFLISSAGGFLLSELEEIRHAANESCSLFDALQEAAAKNSLPHLTEKIETTLHWLEKWRAQAAVLPADRLLRLLLLDENWVQLSSEPPLLMLYEQARVYQRTAWCGLYGFLQHIERLIEGEKLSAAGFAKAENAVTVMTIHHSKGLEFPVVFLISCGSQFNEMDTRESLVFHTQAGVATKLYNPQTAEQNNTALREASILAIKQEQHEENIRTLYVALTRARERLYVSGTLRGKWENMLSNASCVRRGNRSAILSCSSYLSWLLAVIADCQRQNIEFPCIFQHFTLDDGWAEGIPFTGLRQLTDENSVKTNDRSQEYAELLRNRDRVQYPLQILHGLPTKAAASKLKSDLLDSFLEEEDLDERIKDQIELMSSYTPSFDHLLTDRQRVSAADIGTATHAFLEFCDFNRLAQNGFTEEKVRLVEQHFMRSEIAKLVDDKKVEAFTSSELMRWIGQAKKVYREQKFSILVPMSTLTENKDFAEKLGENTLYVQGSIDLLLEMADGRLILVDYKTDRIYENELVDRVALTKRMQKAHGTQLTYYSKAVEQLFGKKPDKICLYLLALGDMIEI